MKKLLTLVLLCLFLGISPVHAEDELHHYLGSVAQRVSTFLKDRGESKIVVHFNGPATFRNSSAEGFIQLLSDQLKEKQIAAVDHASYAFQGQFEVVTGSTADLKLAVMADTGDAAKFNAMQKRLKEYQFLEKDPHVVLKLSGKITDITGKTVGPKIDVFVSEKTPPPRDRLDRQSRQRNARGLSNRRHSKRDSQSDAFADGQCRPSRRG